MFAIFVIPTSSMAFVNSAASSCFPPGWSNLDRSRVMRSAQLPVSVELETDGLVHDNFVVDIVGDGFTDALDTENNIV